MYPPISFSCFLITIMLLMWKKHVARFLMCFLDLRGTALSPLWTRGWKVKSVSYSLLPSLLLLSPGIQAGLKPLPVSATLWPDVSYSNHATELCQCCNWPWHWGFLLFAELLSADLCLYWWLLLESVFTVMVAKWNSLWLFKEKKLYHSDPPSV